MDNMLTNVIGITNAQDRGLLRNTHGYDTMAVYGQVSEEDVVAVVELSTKHQENRNQWLQAVVLPEFGQKRQGFRWLTCQDSGFCDYGCCGVRGWGKPSLSIGLRWQSVMQ